MNPQKIFLNRLRKRISRKLLSSPHAYRLAKEIFLRDGLFEYRAKQQLTAMALEQAAAAYGNRQGVAWTSAFFPSEMIYLFDLVPFAPEIAAATAATFDMAPELLQSAEQYGLSSDCCSFHRCAAAGLDFFPRPSFLMASSHLCDGASRLFSYLGRKTGRPVYLLDVPLEESEEALHYIASQLERIARKLETDTGIRLTESRIADVFGYSNRARHYQLKAMKTRRGLDAPLGGGDGLGYVYLQFLGAGHPQSAEIWKTLDEELNDQAPADRNTGPLNGRTRMVWLHLRPYHSSELIDYLEKELDTDIVMEEVNLVYWAELDPKKPFESLARKVLSNPGLGTIERRAGWIEKMVNDFHADGVIHFSHWGCRQSVGGTLLLRKILREKDIPFLALDGDCIDGTAFPWGQAQTRVEGFFEMIREKLY